MASTEVLMLAPLCPRLADAFQTAAVVVVSLVLGVIPRRTGKASVDPLFINLVLVGEQMGGAIVLGMMNGDDPVSRAKAALALDTMILREMAKGAAIMLVLNAASGPATEVPEEASPSATVVEWLAPLVERAGGDPGDSYLLGSAVTLRLNTCLCILSEPVLWGLLRRVVEVLLRHDQITTDQLDEILKDETLTNLLDDYQTALGDVIPGWHQEVVEVVEVVS